MCLVPMNVKIVPLYQCGIHFFKTWESSKLVPHLHKILRCRFCKQHDINFSQLLSDDTPHAYSNLLYKKDHSSAL